MSSEKSSARKKATKGYYVPSRYKQAAEAISSQSSHSKERSPQRRSAESVLHSTVHLREGDGSISKHGSRRKFASTPDSNGHQPLPPIDASAITDASGFLCVPTKKAPALPATTSTAAKKILQKNKVRDLNSTNIAPVNGTQKSRGKSSSQAIADEEAEINLLYDEYLQSKLLESNAKKALEMRSKDALEKIHEVWCFLQDLMGKNEATRRDLNFVSYYMMLHTHLKKQEEMLLSSLEIIPSLESQYEDIAKAVHTMRHKMEVKDMFLPPASSQGEIIELLQKIKIFLINILKTMSDCDKIIASAESGDLFAKQGKLVLEEIKRSHCLLSDAGNLLLDETSLKLTSV